jgi:hypothetical protein
VILGWRVERQQGAPIDLSTAPNRSVICDEGGRGPSPTNTGYWLGLIHQLRTEEVPLADDQYSEYCTIKDRNLDDTQKMPDDIVDPLHIPDRGAVGSLDQLVIALICLSTTRTVLPVDLEDLVPHRYQREDGGDAACSCEEGAGAKGELVRCGNDIDVVHRAAS